VRRLAPESCLIIGILLATIVCSIPFTQEVGTIYTVEYQSDDSYQYTIAFGGPKVNWVNVICNRTVEIRFMYQNGTWIATQNVLLKAVQAMNVMFNFNAEHSTTVIEIISDGPFLARIVYMYPVEVEMNLFARVFYEMDLNQQFKAADQG
jgi:hypothetical protein